MLLKVEDGGAVFCRAAAGCEALAQVELYKQLFFARAKSS